ncbi:hypothetical protein ACLMJK_007978 [Lecanora helva]
MDLLTSIYSIPPASAADYYEYFKASDTEITLFRYTHNIAMEEKEAQGFSREAYNHSIMVRKWSTHGSRETRSGGLCQPQAQSTYLIRLEGILNSREAIQDAASLSELPETFQESLEAEEATFCRIDAQAKHAIEEWLVNQTSVRKPTFIRISKARKDLHPLSIYPTLGQESTLPQYRLSSPPKFNHRFPHTISPGPPKCQANAPLQDECPVWYFLYGTLADPVILSRVLSLPVDDLPRDSEPACIYGRISKLREGKQEALVEGFDTDTVHGIAYQLCTKEQEEAFLIYETDSYEVVRCEIMMRKQIVRGLTFRIAGNPSQVSSPV